MFADLDQNSIVDFDELSNWIADYASYANLDGLLVGEKDFGDYTTFNQSMWTACNFSSADFDGSLNTVPAPGAIFLCSLGLAFANLKLRKFK